MKFTNRSNQHGFVSKSERGHNGVYSEAGPIREVVSQHEVLVVDDGSKDNTNQEAVLGVATVLRQSFYWFNKTPPHRRRSTTFDIISANSDSQFCQPFLSAERIGQSPLPFHLPYSLLYQLHLQTKSQLNTGIDELIDRTFDLSVGDSFCTKILGTISDRITIDCTSISPFPFRSLPLPIK